MELQDIIKSLDNLIDQNKKDKALNIIQKAVNLGFIHEDILEKAKYIRRTGTKGNYKYIYEEGKGSRGKLNRNITKQELQSLQDYTLENYRIINRELISGKISESVNKQVKDIDSALNKLPKFNGFVYRGMSMPSNIDKLLIDWSKGNEIVMDSFTSTSKNERVAKDFGDFQIKIKSKNGADIQSVSNLEEEAEVLFKTKAKFKVKSIKIKKLKTPFGDRIMSVNTVLEEI